MIAVLTGFGVTFAISASRSFAPASVCFASTTMTLVLPMMIVLLPPAPPRPTHTSGLSCFIVIGGGCCGCCACAGTVNQIKASIPSEGRTVFKLDIRTRPFIKLPLLPDD